MSPRKPLPPYVGQTARGRIVRDETIEMCLDSLAHVMNRETNALAIAATSETSWRVYASQAAANERGDNWIAIITKETP